MKPLPPILTFSFLLFLSSCGKEAIDVGSMSPPDASVSDDAPAGDVGPTGLGAPCQIGTDASPSQGVFSINTPECALCVKPVVDPSSKVPDTEAYCTKGCTQDSDCAGYLRDPSNPNDKGCRLGYACGVQFVKGTLCCRTMCICKDFTAGVAPSVPRGCEGDLALTCEF